MIVKQCVFLDEENNALIGIHYTENNGNDYIIRLDGCDVIVPDEIPYYHDLEGWENDFQSAKLEQARLAEYGKDLQETQNLLEKLIERFGAITISAGRGEFTIDANDGSVYVIPD